MLPRLKAGTDFLLEMKKQGYNIYILSNIVEDSLSYFKSFFSDVCRDEIINGGIYSCEAHLKKPDPKIYQLLVQKYKLKPNECLFLDDTEKNVLAAKDFGMKSILCRPMIEKDAFTKVSQMLKKTK